MNTNKIALSGDLNFIGLGDLLQLVGSIGGTGILRIISKYAPEPGLIYFVKGNIVNAANVLLEADKKAGLNAAYSLFGWLDGEFEFTRQEVDIKKVITTNRMEIILDGLRMVDEGLIPILGPVSFEKKADGKDKTHSIPIIKGPLVDYMYVVDEEEFRKGRTIVQENSYGSWIWVILEGVVDIVKETSQGPLTLIKIADGAFIGSITSFLMQSNPRSATAVAASNVQLGVLDAQRLANDYSERSREFREFALSLDKRLRNITERTIEIFLKKDRLKEFVKDKKPYSVKEGKLFTIEKGEAFIARKTNTGYVSLVNLGKDDFIGHIPFFDIGHEPHSASVFVSEDFEVKEMDTDNLRKEYNRLSVTLKNMIDHIANCISITTSTASSFQKKIAQTKSS